MHLSFCLNVPEMPENHNNLLTVLLEYQKYT